MKSLGLIFLTLLVSIATHAQKVGVVLSGGGASGSAHVGVLKALEENEIPIDFIVGTSIGALVGGFYASGYSPYEIEQIISDPRFRDAANGIVEKEYVYFLKQSESNSSMINIKFNIDSILGKSLPTNFVSSVPIDYGLMEYFSAANAVARSNFDSLFIPFRCLATNITQQQQTIFSEGDLPTSIRASMTYPFYIPPVSMNGDIMLDGGLYNNFPVDVMCDEFLPDYIIASNVGEKQETPTEDNLISQLRAILTRESVFEINCTKGIIINTDVSDIATFDFYGINQALQRGYEMGVYYADSIKKEIEVGRRLDDVQYKREKFKKAMPPLVFDSISFNGIYKNQSHYFKRSLQLDASGISTKRLKPAYYKLTSNEKIKSAYPTATFNPQKGNFDLLLSIKKEKSFSTSFGGVISTKPFNTGFFQLDYQLLKSTELKASGNIYFGSFYNSTEGRLRWDIPFDIPFYIESHFTNNQYDFFNSVVTFIDDNDPPYIIQSERYLESKIGLPVFTKGKLTFGYSYLWQDYEYYQSDAFTRGDTSDLTEFEGFKNFITYERNSLNRKQYATKGSQFSLSIKGFNGREKTKPGSIAPIQTKLNRKRKWFAMHLNFENYFFSKSNFHVGTFVEANYSDLPLFQNYTASVLVSPSFSPLPENRTIFQPQYRARTFVGAGLRAIYSYRDLIDFRAEVYVYDPYEELIRNDDGSASFAKDIVNRDIKIGSLSVIYHSPFGPLAATGNYYSGAEEEFSFLVHFGYILFNKNGFE